MTQHISLSLGTHLTIGITFARDSKTQIYLKYFVILNNNTFINYRKTSIFIYSWWEYKVWLPAIERNLTIALKIAYKFSFRSRILLLGVHSSYNKKNSHEKSHTKTCITHSSRIRKKPQKAKNKNKNQLFTIEIHLT